MLKALSLRRYSYNHALLYSQGFLRVTMKTEAEPCIVPPPFFLPTPPLLLPGNSHGHTGRPG